MKILPTSLATAAIFLAQPALAALPIGARAPDFTTQGAIAGKSFSFRLSTALKRGPVVLYFYPKAFSKGCTLEAHAFAEAAGDFRKAGATVIGVSADDIATLSRFSREACRDKFAVAAATPAVIKSYDVSFPGVPAMADRISYVISRTGRITYAHSGQDYQAHVAETLAQVRKLKKGR